MISNDDKITGRPTVPIVSPVSGGGNGNGHPTSELDDESNGSIWEQDKNREEENESQGGADPSLPWETNLRLPRSVIPNHYDLYLFPDLSTGMFSGKIYIVIAIYCSQHTVAIVVLVLTLWFISFSGNVSIHVTSKEERDHFLVHSKYLHILASNVKRDQKEVDLVEVLPLVHEKHEFLVFRTKDNVPPGNYTINIGRC